MFRISLTGTCMTVGVTKLMAVAAIEFAPSPGLGRRLFAVTSACVSPLLAVRAGLEDSSGRRISILGEAASKPFAKVCLAPGAPVPTAPFTLRPLFRVPPAGKARAPCCTPLSFRGRDKKERDEPGFIGRDEPGIAPSGSPDAIRSVGSSPVSRSPLGPPDRPLNESNCSCHLDRKLSAPGGLS